MFDTTRDREGRDINQRNKELTMKIGLIPINIGMDSLDSMVGLAQFAESLGFETVCRHRRIPVDCAAVPAGQKPD